MTKFIKPLRSGQITIPVEFREVLGINSDSLLQITVEAQELRIKPVQIAKKVSGSAWLKELYDYFADVRKEGKNKHYTKRKINAAIDKAVAAVRKEHD